MTEKLTLQDCFKYPTAEIIRIYDAEITGTYKNSMKYKNVTAMIMDTTKRFPNPKEIKRNPDDFDFFNNTEICKLILRDITQLTDEEKRHIHDNYFYELFKNATETTDVIWKSFDELFLVCGNKIGLIDYLRQQNIMVGKEDWFKSGKAVKG